MIKGNKEQLIDSLVTDSDFYQINMKKIKETVEEFSTVEEKLFYLGYIKKRLEIVLAEFDVIIAESDKPQDPNEFNPRVVAICKLIEYTDLLYYKYNKQLELLDELFGKEKVKVKKMKAEINVIIPELPDEIKKKIDILLTSEEREALNKFIKEKDTQPIPQLQKEEIALLRKKEVMKIFKKSQVTINDWMKTGLLPYSRIKRSIYFKKSDIDELLSAKQNIGRKGKK